VSFAARNPCVASQRVFSVPVVDFIIDSVRKLLDTTSYVYIANTDKDCDLSYDRPVLSTNKTASALTTAKIWSSLREGSPCTICGGQATMGQGFLRVFRYSNHHSTSAGLLRLLLRIQLDISAPETTFPSTQNLLTLKIISRPPLFLSLLDFKPFTQSSL